MVDEMMMIEYRFNCCSAHKFKKKKIRSGKGLPTKESTKVKKNNERKEDMKS